MLRLNKVVNIYQVCQSVDLLNLIKAKMVNLREDILNHTCYAEYLNLNFNNKLKLTKKEWWDLRGWLLEEEPRHIDLEIPNA